MCSISPPARQSTGSRRTDGFLPFCREGILISEVIDTTVYQFDELTDMATTFHYQTHGVAPKIFTKIRLLVALFLPEN